MQKREKRKKYQPTYLFLVVFFELVPFFSLISFSLLFLKNLNHFFFCLSVTMLQGLPHPFKEKEQTSSPTGKSLLDSFTCSIPPGFLYYHFLCFVFLFSFLSFFLLLFISFLSYIAVYVPIPKLWLVACLFVCLP